MNTQSFSKSLVLLFFVGALLHSLCFGQVSSGSPKIDEPSYIQNLRKIESIFTVLEKDQAFRKDPFFAVLKSNLPRYEAMFRSAFVDCKGMKIDFILRAHHNDLTSGGTPKEWIPIVEKSQVATKMILGVTTADLVCLEGGYEKLTDDMSRAIYSRLLEPHSTEVRKEYEQDGMDLSSFEKALPSIAKGSHVFDAAKTSPDFLSEWILANEKRLVSSEDGDLIIIQGSIIWANQDLGELAPPIREIGRIVGELRGEYALARFIIQMRERGAKEGMLVFGAAHGIEFMRLAKEFGIRSRFYNTAPGIKF